MSEFTRLVFGVNASPFLAQCVSQFHTMSFRQMHPKASETILKSTYMDDSMDSVLNEIEGINLYKELSELWKTTGMHSAMENGWNAQSYGKQLECTLTNGCPILQQ